MIKSGYIKKIPTMYTVDIEADKMAMLDSENQKQSFTNAFEYKYS